MEYYEKRVPDEGEIVAVRVDELQEYGVNVTLLEYNMKGMVFSHEISKRRIRSMKEVVRIGQETAATVTKINAEANSVDLSIRMCSPEEIVSTLEQYNRHKVISKLVGRVATLRNIDMRDELELSVWPHIQKETDVYDAFVSVNDSATDAESVLGIHEDAEIQAIRMEHYRKIIRDRLPTPTYTETRDVRIVCLDCLSAPEKLTAALNAVAESGIDVWVIAPPMYRFVATDNNQETARARVEEACALAQSWVV